MVLDGHEAAAMRLPQLLPDLVTGQIGDRLLQDMAQPFQARRPQASLLDALFEAVPVFAGKLLVDADQGDASMSMDRCASAWATWFELPGGSPAAGGPGRAAAGGFRPEATRAKTLPPMYRPSGDRFPR